MAEQGKERLPLHPIPKTKTWSYTQKTGHTSYIGLLSLVPRVSITPEDLLRSTEPLSAPLLVSNDGFLDIHSAKISCQVNHILDAMHASVNISTANGVAGSFELGDIGAGGRTTTFCADGVTLNTPAVEADMVVLLTFRPDFLLWRTTRKFHLRGTVDEKGTFRWVQTSR